MIEVEPLEWWHARRLGVLRLAPEVVGWAFFVDGSVVAIQGAVETDGKVWVFAAGKQRPVFHRWALALLGALAASGVERVYARADAGIDRSDVWLERLGFQRLATGEWSRELDERRGAGRLGVRPDG